VVFLEGHCASFGRATPFLPFIEVVRHAFRLGERDTPAECVFRRILIACSDPS